MEEKKSKLTLNQQQVICWVNRLLPTIPVALFLGFLITISVLQTNQLMSILHLNTTGVQDVKTFLIMLCSFGLFFNLLYLVSAFVANYQKYQHYKMQFLFLSILGLGILQLGTNIVIYSYDRQPDLTPKKLQRKTFLANLGIRKLSTYDITLIGIFVGLTLALAYLETFLPQLPNGGGVALKYIPLIIISFVHSTVAGIFVGGVSALMSLIFIPGALIISPWSYLLDYFLPMISPAIAGVLKFKIGNQKSYLEYLNYVIIVVSVFLLIYLWQVLAGYFVWVAIYGPAWGNNGLVYSVIYNAIQVWIFAYPLAQILTPPILKALSSVYSKRT